MEIGTEIKTKSFWKKPEGITGMLVMIGAGIGLYKLLPYLITFTENTIYLGVMVGSVGVVSYLIINNKSLLWYIYKTTMFKITNFFVTIDPIAVARVYISNLKSKKDDINEQIGKLNGGIERTEGDMKKNQQDIQDKIIEAQEAQKIGMDAQAMLASKEAVRLKEWNKQLEPVLTNMKSVGGVLKKMYNMADYIIKDKESEINITEKKFKSVKIAFSALKSAQAVMGQNDKDAMFEQAMEFIKDDMANKMGEMDRILELAKPFTDNMDLHNAIDERKAMEMLNGFNAQEFEQGILNLSTKTPTPVLLQGNPNAAPAQDGGDNKFGHLFK